MSKNHCFQNENSEYYFLITNLAISSIITQFILLREFLNLFDGNELIISVFLSNWFLIYGLGAFIGKWFKFLKEPKKILPLFTILLIIFPSIIIIIARSLNKLFFPPGFEAGFFYSLIFSFIILFFYCIMQGSLFTLFCQIVDSKTENKINITDIYLLDNIGNIIGGFIYSFILIFLFSNTQNILIPSIFCLFALIFLLFRKKILALFLYTASAIVFILLFFSMNKIDLKTIGYNLQGQSIIKIKETKIGRLIATSTGNQYNFYNNKQLLFSTNDQMKNEEIIHFAACQLDEIKYTLVIGGDIVGTTNELLKYSPQSVTCIIPDINIIKLSEKYSTFKENKIVKIIINDGRNYIQNCSKKYDIIILDMPPPSSLQLNRFYTVEFFKIIKSKLKQNGIFSFSIPSNENYLNKHQTALISSLYNSMNLPAAS
jgi:spermidine synthase